MFYGCPLIISQELSATTLVRGCYNTMFSHCSSLVRTPELPAITLIESCYAWVFSACTSLETVKIKATSIVYME